MSNIELHDKKLPTIQELYENTDLAIQHDQLAVLLNQNPPDKWIKTHPYVKSHRYLPIDKCEWLLRRIFKQNKVEITGQGTAFNGVWVTVRVHYMHPISNTWEFHDGIGAAQLQTKSGSSPADLGNINNGALAMAFPIAKTAAFKDACDHFGRAFGSDLNRKEIMPYTQDETLHDVKRRKEIERLERLIQSAKDIDELELLREHVARIEDDEITELYATKEKELKK